MTHFTMLGDSWAQSVDVQEAKTPSQVGFFFVSLKWCLIRNWLKLTSVC